MKKSDFLTQLQDALEAIVRSSGYHTDLGLNVEYGMDEPAWRESDSIQWIDSVQDYQTRHDSMLQVEISVLVYGDRPTLLKRSLDAESDVRQALAHCCLKRGKVSLTKKLEESGDNSAINLMFVMEAEFHGEI